MDRRLSVLLVFLFAAAVGCGGDSGPQSPTSGLGPQQGAGNAGGDCVAETHRPVIVDSGSSQPGESLAPETSLASEFPQSAGESPLEMSSSEFSPASDPAEAQFPAAEPDAQAPAAAADPRLENPLRTADAQPREAPNPLRSRHSFSVTPRSAAPKIDQPAGGPNFEPLAIEPSTGVAATGPAAPEASFAEPGSAEPAAPQPSAVRSAAPLASGTTPAGECDVVQVFYGTDRASIEPPSDNLTTRVVRFLPTGFAMLVTLTLVLIATSKRNVALWSLVVVGLAATAGLGYQATASTLFAIRWEGKLGPQYTIERSPNGEVQLGICAVSIPKVHQSGALEAPSILHLEVREDAAQHVLLSKTERLADERFYELLRERVQASPRQELFVFVHGFNVQFEDAARRTAQIHHDLKFQGAPIFFSWPANNKFLLTYPADETTITWSTPHLKQFLLEIVQRSGAQSINLIAHSMGNRGLTAALREIELEFRGESRLFNHVVLAAPDIDADDFRTNIAPAMQRTAKQVTLYASSRDDALRISQLLHRGPRAGDSGRGLVVLPGIDTIDVTAIDTSPWGHVYYGDSDPVLQDLKVIFQHSAAPQDRTWLSPAQQGGVTYWIFEASQTAARASLSPR